jgi:hypothetical protein
MSGHVILAEHVEHFASTSSTAHKILRTVHVAYPIILLVFYLVVATTFSILNSKSEDNGSEDSKQAGPGGKPLPKKSPTRRMTNSSQRNEFSHSRKLFFQWTSIGIVFSFIGNIVIVILHALVEQEERYWCGQAMTVCERIKRQRQEHFGLTKRDRSTS